MERGLRLPLLLLVFTCIFIPCLGQEGDANFILEHADRAKFLKFSLKEGTATFEGRVKANYKNIRLEADWIQVDNRYIIARGNVLLRQPQGVFYGKEILYDFSQKKVTARGIEGQIQDFYIKAEEIEAQDDDRITIKGGVFTTCSYNPPHYKIKATKVIIYPQRSLWAYNAVPYIGKNLPFLYLPIYYRSLRHKGPHLFITPGYSDIDGLYLKSKYRIYLEDDHLDLLLDYFQRRGIGKGVDYQYHFGKEGRGVASLYHIREKEILYPSHPQRWRFLLSHYQTFLEELTLKGRLEYRSDDHDIKGEDYHRTSKIESYLALTQRKTNYILSLSGRQKHIWDGKSFIKRLSESPRISLWQRPLDLGPLYYQVKGNLINQYPIRNNEYGFLGGLEAILFSRLKIGSRLTLSPEIGLSQELKERTNLLTGLTIKTRFSRIEGDLKYRLKKGPNEPYPELEEILGLLNLTIPRWCRVMVNTTYDLAEKRYRPIIGEVNLSSLPTGIRLGLFSRYHIQREVLESFNLSLDRDGQRWEGGLAAYFVKLDGKAKDILDLEGKIGFWPTTKMKVGLKGRYDTRNEEVEYWEASIYRDLHCWKLECGIRHHPLFIPKGQDKTEGWIKISLLGF